MRITIVAWKIRNIRYKNCDRHAFIIGLHIRIIISRLYDKLLRISIQHHFQVSRLTQGNQLIRLLNIVKGSLTLYVVVLFCFSVTIPPEGNQQGVEDMFMHNKYTQLQSHVSR